MQRLEEVAPGRGQLNAQSGCKARPSMKKILIIEDDADLFALLKYNITKEGFSLTGPHTGKGALKLCRQTRPDLILLDQPVTDSLRARLRLHLRAAPGDTSELA